MTAVRYVLACKEKGRKICTEKEIKTEPLVGDRICIGSRQEPELREPLTVDDRLHKTEEGILEIGFEEQIPSDLFDLLVRERGWKEM